MNLEKAKQKLKIYKWILISIILIYWILFICIFMPQSKAGIIFSIVFVTTIIPTIIINKKRKYYKKLVYDLSVQEKAINDTINNKHLK